jgi:hypothetical protein
MELRMRLLPATRLRRRRNAQSVQDGLDMPEITQPRTMQRTSPSKSERQSDHIAGIQGPE